jgi:hypothetical protein
MIRAPYSHFREFTELELDEDIVCRSYNLLAYGASVALVRHAVIALGYSGAVSVEYVESDLRAKLANERAHVQPHLDSYTFREILVMWYNWYRIKNKYVRKWPMKSHANGGYRGPKENPATQGGEAL